MSFPHMCFSAVFLWTASSGYKLSQQVTVAKEELRPVKTTAPQSLSYENLMEITAMIENDGLYIAAMPESPYLRIGFHIAASYDRLMQKGGWNELPTRATLRKAGLLDDILIVYWDVMEQYWINNVDSLHGMTRADFISYLIYMFSKSGIFTPNVTWRAGRSESGSNSGDHMKNGRPFLGAGMSQAFKPEANMTTPAYLREFFSRLNFDDDSEVALLMTAHALGSARGLPYLGELASKKVNHYKITNTNRVTCGVGACYFWDMLNLEWEVGCPTSCTTCLWGWTGQQKGVYNSKDPYNTTWKYAPQNYTTSSSWGDACTLELAKEGLFEYRDTVSKATMRLPAEMALLQDTSYVKAMTYYSENSDDDKRYAADFAHAYSKMLEVGVPEGQLYHILDLVGATPPFSDAAGPPEGTVLPDEADD
eukprot:CAMPEP_0194482416 /NCGR_PEP_ID=MMETSP0253-20130528/4376_1 /TAXON_ID=2966 /ORGANISM="Noctiluca scintillans" /LENGTH=421 /DNA_ID=CAMNT_0039321953 /DNA_START=58 /DNA_END=1323 /DNA_ORIENTATION=+